VHLNGLEGYGDGVILVRSYYNYTASETEEKRENPITGCSVFGSIFQPRKLPNTYWNAKHSISTFGLYCHDLEL
jgi:hypothetical protein